MQFRNGAVKSIVLLLLFSTVVFGAKAISVEKLRIKKQLTGWFEESGSYQLINTKNLYEIINGGAPPYIDNGMKKGIYQRLMTSDSSVTIELFAEDFGSIENAKKMLKDKTTAAANDSSTNKSSENRILDKIVGGYWCCEIIDQYYFEITLTGITDKEKAAGELDRVIAFYRKVIKGGKD